MASRFWVAGGNGNWSSTTNWSATTGGASGASVPTSADDAFVNALSGTSPVITVDVASNCLSLDFTGAITPTLAGSTTLSIYGSWTSISTLTITHTGTKAFLATSSGKTITSAGVSMNSTVQTNSTTGGWTLQDALTCIIFVNTAGTFDTNGKTMTVSQFRSNSTSVRSVSLGASVINNSGDWLFDVTTNLTFNSGTSTINMTGASKTFDGGSKTFYNVTFTGTPSTIVGSNTFNTLTFTAGKTVNLTSGTIQTVTNLVCNGTAALPSTLQSVTAGSAATISKASGICYLRHCSIKDITATGGATFTSIAGTNTSGNTGITFVAQLLIGQIKVSTTVESLYWTDTNGVLQKISG